MREKLQGSDSVFAKDYDYMDSDNDVTDDGYEIGPVWRKVCLQLLTQQIQQQLHFLGEIASKRQVTKSIRLNFNNTEISDDDFVFKTILKGLKYFLITITDQGKSVEKLEIIFLRTHRNERNDEYAEEIKKFLEAISDKESLKESMQSVVFDSMANEIMIGLVSSFSNLQELKIKDGIYLEGQYFPLIKTKCLRKLNLSGSHQIDYEHIRDIVKNNAGSLRSLKIDGENLDGEEFGELIYSISVLEELCIYYAHSANSDLLKILAKHGDTLQKLIIRKNENFESDDFMIFFSRKFCKLETLILDEGTFFDTDGVKFVATNGLALKYYSSEWGLKINSEAIESLILNCENLEILNGTGIKTIDDTIFSKLFEKNTQNQKNGEDIIPLVLKEINLKMGNHLSKPVLEQMKVYYPKLKILDYYGEEVNFYGKFTNYSSENKCLQ